jgi:peptidoglycan/xylan/chitin deacetylase (PgdA/CDA1 family)
VGKEHRASAWGRPVLAAAVLLPLTTAAATLLGSALSPGWLILDLSLLATVIAVGVVVQSSGVFARPVIASGTPRPELALTFDDGPDPVHTPPILAALEAGGHRGTFFVIGERAAKYPELLAEIARRGHGVENHSYHHSYLTNLLPPKRLARELAQTSALIAETTGQPPRWFRPPVGLLSPRIAAAARLARLELVAWTASARDGVASRTVADAAARLEPHLRPGAILVLHDGPRRGGGAPIALSVLQIVLEQMETRGLRSVRLDQLLRPGAPPSQDPRRESAQREPEHGPQRQAAHGHIDEDSPKE